ncbi:hypothetical protein HDZ31DRAFT_62752 [Schizophyllum fasciatum]
MSSSIVSCVQNLTLLDSPTSSASTSSGPPEEKKSQTRRRKRPLIHKRLHPSHADIPYVPEARNTSTHRHWHFGWPLSDDFVNNFLDTYVPGFLDRDQAIPVKYGRFMLLAQGLARYERLYLVLVEHNAYAPSQSPLADPEETASTFVMMLSDRNNRLFNNRPTKEQMARLVHMFGSEPCWMMDAREKKRWAEYGHPMY